MVAEYNKRLHVKHELICKKELVFGLCEVNSESEISSNSKVIAFCLEIFFVVQ